MFNWIIKKIIGTKNQRTVRKLQPVVVEINRIEAQLQNEPEEALRERTQKWQQQFQAFHTPPFLGGVGLRIADEAAVDACLEAVEKYFSALKPHFPALESDYLVPAAWRSASLDDKKGRIDRAQMFEFIAPGLIVQLSAADEAGTFTDGLPDSSKLQFRLFHGLTPETDTTCFYFWSTANGFRPNDPAATEQLFQEIGAAFVEDLTVVEGQQARLSELGEDALVDIANDSSRRHMRRTMERMLAGDAPALAAE